MKILTMREWLDAEGFRPAASGRWEQSYLTSEISRVTIRVQEQGEDWMIYAGYEPNYWVNLGTARTVSDLGHVVALMRTLAWRCPLARLDYAASARLQKSLAPSPWRLWLCEVRQWFCSFWP